nr:lipoprotein [uncultured Marinobacter sp.]
MRVWTWPALVLIVMTVLAGCGQKGALYREDPADSAGVEASASDQDADGTAGPRDRNRDGSQGPGIDPA